ncbi:AraC family transcriptional regulator [Larkinella ripae]
MKREMTDQGESMTPEGEIGQIGLTGFRGPTGIRYNPVFFGEEKDLIVEERDQHLQDGLDGSSYEFISGGIHIWYGTMCLSRKIKTRFANVKSYIQMVFSMRSDSTYNFEDTNRFSYKFSDQEHNILALPANYLFVELKPANQLETLSINLSPDLFFSYFSATTSLLTGFKRSLEKQVPSRLSKRNLPITPRINSLLYEIIHCPLNGYSKRLYIEAKIIELLALQLDQYEQGYNEPAHANLKKEEVEKMHQIQQLISEHPEQAFSLKEMARQVGTNEYNLKKHFKQVFGTTVFGYIQTFRMEKAKEMLADSTMKIAEISRQVGYKHATHFTTAFKKHFGFLPHKLKAMVWLQFVELDTFLLEVI